jgi:hypothetical protein
MDYKYDDLETLDFAGKIVVFHVVRWCPEFPLMSPSQ